jgi:signal transduction histidine kinase
LTHDIRNYNQIARMSSEVLKKQLVEGNDVGTSNLIDILINAIDRSTSLVDRMKMLGKVISESSPSLYPVNLIEFLENSLNVVSSSNPTLKINATVESYVGSDLNQIEVRVLADELVYEVFTNVFSNSVRYTVEEPVQINVTLGYGDEEERNRTAFEVITRIEQARFPTRILIFGAFQLWTMASASQMNLNRESFQDIKRARKEAVSVCLSFMLSWFKGMAARFVSKIEWKVIIPKGLR